MSALALQIICFIGGTLTLYVALFSYEDEDQKLQDSLEQWWVHLRDLEGGMWQKARELVRKSNLIVERFLNRLLGHEILSKQFFAVSIVLSFVVVIPIILSFFPIPLPLGILVSLLILWRALLPLKTGKPPYILAPFLFALVLSPLLNLLNPDYTDDYEWVLVIAGIFSLASDAVVTIVVRLFLRAFGATYPLLFFSCLPIVVFMIIAVFTIISVGFLGPFSWMLLPAMNFPTLFFAFLVWFVPIIIVTGKIAVHIIGRGIYSMQRRRVFHNKKLMWGLAMTQYSVVPFMQNLIEEIKSLV